VIGKKSGGLNRRTKYLFFKKVRKTHTHIFKILVHRELTTTITVSEYTYANADISVNMKLRGYNVDATTSDTLQHGPTLRFKAGDTVKVTLQNDMATCGATCTHPASGNGYHYSQKTNLHTHGLHVSPESGSDDVFSTVEPGTSGTYTYEIPSDHAGGTFWYHAHHHGSTSLHAASGMIGFMIVEDAADEVPSAILNADEVGPLAIAYMDLPALKSIATDSPGEVWTSDAASDDGGYTGYFVNGKVKPNYDVKLNRWTRIRTVFLATDKDAIISHDGATSGQSCEWYLLAKDGVYVSPAPRALDDGKLYLAPGNRADVMMRCTGSLGTVTVSAEAAAKKRRRSLLQGPGGGGSVAGDLFTITVIADDSAVKTGENYDDLSQFNPKRPAYLMQTLKDEPAGLPTPVTKSVTFTQATGGCGVNNEQFVDKDTSLGSVDLGTVQKWTVNGNEKHPLHIHVNSFQLSGVTDASGYFQDGDWHDVVYRPTGVTIDNYYFMVDRFAGKKVVHCHFLTHEDKGCMGFYTINGAEGTTVSGATASALVTLTTTTSDLASDGTTTTTTTTTTTSSVAGLASMMRSKTIYLFVTTAVTLFFL